MTRKSNPGGAAPYSAALISLSVPSTPTRSTFTSTPRPSGTSSTDGLGSCARCIELGMPGRTATAFIMGRAGSCVAAARSRVEVDTAAPPARSLLGMNFSFVLYELDDVTIGIADQDAAVKAERGVGQLHRRGGDEAEPASPEGGSRGARVGYRH